VGNRIQRQHSDSFDALGRVLHDIGGVGQTTTLAYDPNGNALTVTDPLGRVTERAFDALNRLNTVTDPIPASPQSPMTLTTGRSP
jgi:YD repeat-containing protein